MNPDDSAETVSLGTSLPASGTQPTEPTTGKQPTGLTTGAALTGVTVGAQPATPQPAGKRPTGLLEVGQRFGARYHILRQLGIGGMGAVYQAWDADLGVAVALKVILPEVTRDPVAAQDIERRFKQELLLARQVTHKNVVRIHDLGEIDGIKYITMPCIEGQDLASVVRHGRLPVPKVMVLARQVSAGLQAAHEAGVVHRDLKPANVMLEGEHAIIMDFGIARSTSRGGAPAPRPAVAATGAGSVVLDVGADAEMTRIAETVVGEVIGTIEYMAPEQARGEHVDQRADVYAFGLIIYDLLTGGRHSEHAVSAVGELQKRLAAPPPSIRTVLPDIPQPLDQLLTKCTEPDAANRYQTSAELVAALELLDDNGKLRPIKHAIRLPHAVAAALLLLAFSGYIWWSMRPPVTHDPISVVIADFVNGTGDPTFDNALTQTVQRALQDASFISAYDRSRVSALGVRPPEKLAEAAARELALKQGLGVVVSGSIEPQRTGYRISVKAIQTVTGDVIINRSTSAADKGQVLETATRLMARVRSALGDQTSEADQVFAMRSVSANSLEVIAHYAAAMEAQAKGNWDGARQSFQKAVDLDPTFALGYQGLAAMARNQGRLAEIDENVQKALKFVPNLTERERLTTRGFYYWATGDNSQCVKEHNQLLSRYQADVVARSMLAICLKNLRNMRGAIDEIRQAVKVLPNHVVLRTNLALFANFAGEFEAAEREAKSLTPATRPSLLALAFSQIGRGLVSEAKQTYEKLAMTDARGLSLVASGVGDALVYEGRFSDAIETFERGAAADLSAKNPDGAAIKFNSIAHAALLLGPKGRSQALAAANKALANSKAPHVKFLAARTFVEAGDIDTAKRLATELSSSPNVWGGTAVHGKIIEAGIALNGGDPEQSIKLLTEANATLDTWFAHYDLGRAYLAAGKFVRADSEFDTCIRRSGEAILLMDEDPTYGYFPSVYYYQGQVREKQNMAGFADSYGNTAIFVAGQKKIHSSPRSVAK